MPFAVNPLGMIPKGVCELVTRNGDDLKRCTGALIDNMLLSAKHCINGNYKLETVTCSPDQKIDIKDSIITHQNRHDFTMIELTKTYESDLVFPPEDVLKTFYSRQLTEDKMALHTWGHGGTKEIGLEAVGMKSFMAQDSAPNYILNTMAITEDAYVMHGDSGGPVILPFKGKQYLMGNSVGIYGNGFKKEYSVWNNTSHKFSQDWLKATLENNKYSRLHKLAFETQNLALIEDLYSKVKNAKGFFNFFKTLLENPTKEYSDQILNMLKKKMVEFRYLSPSNSEYLNFLQKYEHLLSEPNYLSMFYNIKSSTIDEWAQYDKYIKKLALTNSNPDILSSLEKINTYFFDELNKIEISKTDLEHILHRHALTTNQFENLANRVLNKVKTQYEFKDFIIRIFDITSKKENKYLLSKSLVKNMSQFSEDKYSELPIKKGIFSCFSALNSLINLNKAQMNLFNKVLI